jgi:hypothetical protein
MKFTVYNPSQPDPGIYEEGSDAWRKAVAHQEAEARRRANSPSEAIGCVIFGFMILAFAVPLGAILAWEQLVRYDPLGGFGSGALILGALALVAYKLPRSAGAILLIWSGMLLIRVLAPLIFPGVTASPGVLGGPAGEGAVVVLLAALGIYLVRIGTNRKYGPARQTSR